MTRRYELQWTRVAEQDLKSLIEYLFEKDHGAAISSFEKIETIAQNLQFFPERGRVVPELKRQNITGYRELLIEHWRLVYRIVEENVYILAILDSRRNLEDLLLARLTR